MFTSMVISLTGRKEVCFTTISSEYASLPYLFSNIYKPIIPLTVLGFSFFQFFSAMAKVTFILIGSSSMSLISDSLKFIRYFGFIDQVLWIKKNIYVSRFFVFLVQMASASRNVFFPLSDDHLISLLVKFHQLYRVVRVHSKFIVEDTFLTIWRRDNNEWTFSRIPFEE